MAWWRQLDELRILGEEGATAGISVKKKVAMPELIV
jgi:hypothetical protein